MLRNLLTRTFLSARYRLSMLVGWRTVAALNVLVFHSFFLWFWDRSSSVVHDRPSNNHLVEESCSNGYRRGVACTCWVCLSVVSVASVSASASSFSSIVDYVHIVRRICCVSPHWRALVLVVCVSKGYSMTLLFKGVCVVERRNHASERIFCLQLDSNHSMSIADSSCRPPPSFFLRICVPSSLLQYSLFYSLCPSLPFSSLVLGPLDVASSYHEVASVVSQAIRL